MKNWLKKAIVVCCFLMPLWPTESDGSLCEGEIATMIGALGAATLSAGASIWGNHQRNEAQQRENQLAFERERQQIAEMNAYNSSSAQIARLAAAGLNPNMMYGQPPGQAAGLQSDIAHYQPAEMTNAFGDVGETAANTLNALVGLREQENKNMLAESQILLNEGMTAREWMDCEFTKTQNDRMWYLLGYEAEEIESNVHKNYSEIAKNEQLIEESKAKIDEIKANTDLLKKQWDLTDAQIDNLDAETIEILALLPGRKALLEMDAQQRMAAIELAYAQAGYIRGAQTDLTRAQEFATYTYRDLAKQENAREWIYGGVDRLVNVAGAVMDVIGLTPASGLGNPVGMLRGSGGTTPRATHGSPRNSVKGFTPETGSFKRSPAPKRSGSR